MSWFILNYWKGKHKERSKNAKKANNGEGNFTHAKSDRHGCSRFRHRFSRQGSSNVRSKLKKHSVSNPNT